LPPVLTSSAACRSLAYKLELADGSAGDPPAYKAAVPTWQPGDKIPIKPGKTLRVIDIRPARSAASRSRSRPMCGFGRSSRRSRHHPSPPQPRQERQDNALGQPRPSHDLPCRTHVALQPLCVLAR
jgi:hypothetical protein